MIDFSLDHRDNSICICGLSARNFIKVDLPEPATWNRLYAKELDLRESVIGILYGGYFPPQTDDNKYQILVSKSDGSDCNQEVLLRLATSEFEPPNDLDEVEDLFYSQVMLEQFYSKILGHMDGSSGDTGTNILLYFFQEHIFHVLDQYRGRSVCDKAFVLTPARHRKREAFFCQVKDMMNSSKVTHDTDSEVVSDA